MCRRREGGRGEGGTVLYEQREHPQPDEVAREIVRFDFFEDYGEGFVFERALAEDLEGAGGGRAGGRGVSYLPSWQRRGQV